MASRETNATTYTANEVEEIIRDASHQSVFDHLCVTFYRFSSETIVDPRCLLGEIAPFTATGKTASSSLGALDSLPVDILIPILMDLDLASAIQFSQVSRRARELASTIFEFRALREHGMEFLCSLIHTGMAPHVSMRSLFSALTTENCQVCGRFGGYVFLPNLTRCCYKCVQKCRPMVSVQSLKVVSQETGLTHEQLKESLPVYKAPIVTSDDPTYIHPLYPYFLVLPGDRTQREYSALSHIAADLDRRGLECPRARTLSRDWRWFVRSRQTLAALPYFNMETGEAQLARYCNACLASQTGVHRDVRSIAPSTRGTGYSREGFVRHFKECQAARDEWRKGVRGIEGLIGAISNRQRQMLMQY